MSTEFDYSDYQVQIDGKVVPITCLSREDLIRELRKAIDCLEDLDEILQKSHSVLHTWRYDGTRNK
jgi:hypothetical protein